MKIRNIKTTIPTTLILLLSLFFFGIIGLTSCEKENEITKTEVGEAVNQVKPNEEPIERDSTECERIDYTTEIITSNWLIKDRISRYGGVDIDFFDENFGIVADNTHVSVYGGNGNIRITYDGGETWVTKSAPMTVIAKVKTLGIDTFLVSRHGMYESKNGGISYSVFGDESNTNKMSTFNFHIFDSAHFITEQGTALEVTHNKGKDWTLFRGVYADNLQFFGNKLGYASGGHSGGGTTGGFFSNGFIHKTFDGGSSWTQLDVNPEQITAMYFTDENTGIFADSSGIIYKTTDGGITWNIITTALCGYYAWDMLFIDENVGYLTSSYGLIFKTEDGGYTWQVDYYSGEKDNSGYDLDFTALAKTPNNTVYITGYATMKRID